MYNFNVDKHVCNIYDLEQIQVSQSPQNHKIQPDILTSLRCFEPTHIKKLLEERQIQKWCNTYAEIEVASHPRHRLALIAFTNS